LPGFVIRYLKRVLHQDQINKSLLDNKDVMGLDFVRNILREFNASIYVSGLENLPESGRYIVVSNHPLGGLDGLALMHVVGKVRRDIIFPVNDFLLYLPNLKELFIPINKVGKNTENAAKIESAFESDKIILYFPAGLCSRKINGKICDLEWKKTFISKARKYNRDIIPVFIDAENSNFFYRLANIRKKLGIKANIEMLYLVDEMYKQYNKKINIIFGEKIPVSFFTKDKKDNEWAAYVKEWVYSLKKNKENNVFKSVEI
jgi:putative hemolysin